MSAAGVVGAGVAVHAAVSALKRAQKKTQTEAPRKTPSEKTEA